MSLLINKYNYQPIDRKTENGRRLYSCPDGSKVPSVTTILDATKPLEKRKALAEWRRRTGEQKAQQITTEAANRGTRMHAYLEDYIKTGTVKDRVGNPYAQQSLIMAKTVIAQGMPNINEVWGSEVALYYPGLYAGTTDCVGVHLSEASILDFKQSNKPKKEEWIEDYYLQLAAYAEAHNKIHNTNIRKGVVLMCVKPPELTPGVWGDPQYQEFILTPDHYNYWSNKWWDRVTEYYENN
jgi:genome maintenance exonuclease 1